MLDFMECSMKNTKNGPTICPNFIVQNSEDLMIRGGKFYAIWDEENKIWSTDKNVAVRLIDKDLEQFSRQYDGATVLYARYADSGTIDKFNKFCERQIWDMYDPLDEKVMFMNTERHKKDFASKYLPYILEPGDISAYEELTNTLYSPEELKKIEWAIGSIVVGDSKRIQKFIVMYGSAGTGKSTILNIISMLFEGYCSNFEAKALGQANSAFALEPFKNNPLVGIQHDGNLSKIEDNTRLNSLISHEQMVVNEKNKSMYTMKFNTFLFMGTNNPVRITDAKSGILRRLIDVTPTGKRVGVRRYDELMEKIKFELGPIAYHCREVYMNDPKAYDGYTPNSMLDETNDFYNFVLEYYDKLGYGDGITLTSAWNNYKEYIEDAKVPYPLNKRQFKNELKNYYKEFYTQKKVNNESVKNYYEGFDFDSIGYKPANDDSVEEVRPWLGFADIASGFDITCADYPAQYANDKGTPSLKWDSVESTLAELDTRKLHYVKMTDICHIVIDFDIPDENGNKSFEKNFEAASKWPPTYAELSKSGAGIHLHYIYSGDPTELAAVYDDHIEVKVFKGNSSLRRCLTKCNNLPISTINSGLPFKEKKGNKMINDKIVMTEKGLRKSIIKALNKEVHPNTKPNIDFIKKALDDMYETGKPYDVSDMRPAISAFAMSSTNNAMYCSKQLSYMHFKSEEIEHEAAEQIDDDEPIIFYDIEVFPNLLLVNWKAAGDDTKVVRMINPTPIEIEELVKHKLVGFNCRRYDNHILYARIMGYNNEQLYHLSKMIINSKKGENSNCFFREAYNLSYTDVYDFASAGNKMSLKKWEIKLKIHHQELGLSWDEPVPEESWEKVAEYCDNDVISTEAVFNHLQGDWKARQILATLTDSTPNDTTNTLSTRFIFGNNRKPQNEFNYRDLSKPVRPDDEMLLNFPKDKVYRVYNDLGEPEYRDYIPGEILPPGWSVLPFFPGYKYERGVSSYKDVEKVGEGGYVYAEPSMEWNVETLDVASEHPSSAIEECLFGPEYTQRFADIKYIRVLIKHKKFEEAGNLMGGVLKPYLTDHNIAKALSNALKTVINSVYGLTSASFANPFRDPRNIDNIVAKRGALFMINLRNEVQKRGYKVLHCKTDSIKIVGVDDNIRQFCIDYGKEFGYDFETEHIFEKICLVNNAVYIAKLSTEDAEWVAACKDASENNKPEPTRWTATGTQFMIPYVFKTLFSHEPIIFDDLCETKEVKTAMYLDMNEDLPDHSAEIKSLEKQRDSMTTLGPQIGGLTFEMINEQITELKALDHRYEFIGKVGSFCPIKPGCCGGELVRENTDKDGNIKYDSVTGTKGMRWLEAEIVKDLGKENDIDKRYYQKLVDEALETLSAYGDTEVFVA